MSAAAPPNPPRPAAPNNAVPNNAVPNNAAESALERLRAAQAAREAPGLPRPGAPGGGSPTGIANAGLTPAQGRAIGDQLRECWTADRAALDFDQQSVRLLITTDAAGVVRDAVISPNDAGKLGTGVSRAFAERARRAALDPDCARLPLPPALLGRRQDFEITFRP